MSISNVMDKHPNYRISKSKSKLQSWTLMFVNAIIVISNTHKHTKIMTRSVSIMIVCSLVLLLPIITLDPVAFAAKNINRGPIDCKPGIESDHVICCQTSTDDENIEQTYCTLCKNTNPPSQCLERWQVDNFNPHTGTHSSGGNTLEQPDSSNNNDDSDNKDNSRTNVPIGKGGIATQ